MKRSVRLLLAALAIVAVAAWVGHADQPVPVETSATSVTDTDAGYRVYIDPTTGEFTEPTPSDFPPLEAASRSEEGLIEESSPVSGVMVNLQGRYQETMTATVDGDKAVVGCGTHEIKTEEE